MRMYIVTCEAWVSRAATFVIYFDQRMPRGRRRNDRAHFEQAIACHKVDGLNLI